MYLSLKGAGVNENIRLETLKPAHDWVVPSSEEIKEMLKMAGLNCSSFSKLIGMSTQKNKSGNANRNVRKWISGEQPIPYAAWSILVHCAGLGIIWK